MTLGNSFSDSLSTPVYQDVVENAHQLIVACFALGRALVQTLYAVLRLSLYFWHRFSPYVLHGLRTTSNIIWTTAGYTARWYWEASERTRWIFLGVFAATLSGVVLVQKRVVPRVARKVRRMARRGGRSLRQGALQIRSLMSRVKHVGVNVGIAVLPIILVFLPLQYSLSPRRFRQLFNVVTFVVPVGFSLVALGRYYQARRALLHPQSVLCPALSSSVVKPNSTKGYRGSGGAQDHDSVRRDGSVTVNGSMENSRVQQLETEKVLRAWLEYWVSATFFDLLFQAPLFVSRLCVRSPDFGAQFGAFGYVHDEVRPSHLMRGNFFFSSRGYRPPTTEHLAGLFNQGFMFVHDVVYTLLLVFVISGQERHLRFARTLFTKLLDTVVLYIVGIRVTDVLNVSPPSITCPFERPDPTSPIPDPSAACSYGLLPLVWTFLSARLSPKALFVLHILFYVPQLFLLLCPPILLPLCIFCLGSFYPALSAVRSLTTSCNAGQLYWLCYYILRKSYETLLIQWLRATFLWRWLPLGNHVELIAITLIQLLCTRQDLVGDVLLAAVLPGSASSCTRTPPPSIKQEPTNTASKGLTPATPELPERLDSFARHHPRKEPRSRESGRSAPSRFHRNSQPDAHQETAGREVDSTLWSDAEYPSAERNGSQRDESCAAAQALERGPQPSTQYIPAAVVQQVAANKDQRRYITRSSVRRSKTRRSESSATSDGQSATERDSQRRRNSSSHEKSVRPVLWCESHRHTASSMGHPTGKLSRSKLSKRIQRAPRPDNDTENDDHASCSPGPHDSGT